MRNPELIVGILKKVHVSLQPLLLSKGLWGVIIASLMAGAVITMESFVETHNEIYVFDYPIVTKMGPAKPLGPDVVKQ